MKQCSHRGFLPEMILVKGDPCVPTYGLARIRVLVLYCRKGKLLTQFLLMFVAIVSMSKDMFDDQSLQLQAYKL